MREWLSRAVHAARDPVWTADGVVADAWAPVSPVTGRLDAFEWKAPATPLSPIEAMPVDEGLLHSLPEELPEEDDTPAIVEVLPAPVALDPDQGEGETANSAAGREKQPVEDADASEPKGDGKAPDDDQTRVAEPAMPAAADAAVDQPPAEETATAHAAPDRTEPAITAPGDAGNGRSSEDLAKDDAAAAKDTETASADTPAVADADQPATADDAAEVDVREDDAPTPVKFPLERPPDDPGPDGAADESDGRFKLF